MIDRTRPPRELSALARIVIGCFVTWEISMVSVTVMASMPRRPLPGDLSDRERQVLRFIAMGKSDREIAELLEISRTTVSNHASNIYRKFRVSTRTAAAIRGVELGLISTNTDVTEVIEYIGECDCGIQFAGTEPEVIRLQLREHSLVSHRVVLTPKQADARIQQKDSPTD